MRRISLSHSDVRRIRTLALVLSIVLHLCVIGFLLFLQFRRPELFTLNNLDLRSSGGGGGADLKLYEIEFGPQSGNQTQNPVDQEVPKFTVKNIPPEQVSSVGTPVIKQEKKKKRQKKVEDRLFGENLGTKHHRGTGPGAGGGMGGGVGGGIGKSSGYSIDWGGIGSRRLLSGRLPKYPEGTNKEMPVFLQFTVLPDGSVSDVLPMRRSDELLEREAIAALKTWRFDPLPSQIEQKAQTGKITFNFKLE